MRMADQTLEIEQRALGSSGKTIPRIALGCGNFGGIGSAPAFFGQGLTDEQAMELMDAAWAMGITHFDTADAYGGGRSELAIGRWIEHSPRAPDDHHQDVQPDGRRRRPRARRPSGSGASSTRASIGWASITSSCISRTTSTPTPRSSETMTAFEALAAMGEIGAYGVSNFDAAQLERSAPSRATRRRSRTTTRCSSAPTRPTCCRCARSAASPTWRSARSRADG